MREQNKDDLMQLDDLVVDAEVHELEDAETGTAKETASAMDAEPADAPEEPFTKQRTNEAKKQAKVEKTAAAPRYVGRFTLGIAMIIMGVLITAGLFHPTLDLTKLARLAPLMLVLLGAEILVAAARRGDHQVKVGFGMTILCLFIICGSACFAILPTIWEQHNTIQWERMEKASNVEEQIYAQLPPATIKRLDVNFYGDDFSHEPVYFHANVTLADTFPDKESFSEKAAEVLRVLAAYNLDQVYLEAGTEEDLYFVSVEHIGVYANVQAKDLQKLVNHNVYYVDQDMNFNSMSEERYQQMKEKNLLADAEALKRAYEEGRSIGSEEAYQEMQSGIDTGDAYEEGRRVGYEEGFQAGVASDEKPTSPEVPESAEG